MHRAFNLLVFPNYVHTVVVVVFILLKGLCVLRRYSTLKKTLLLLNREVSCSKDVVQILRRYAIDKSYFILSADST